MHIMGEKDENIPNERSLQLANFFQPADMEMGGENQACGSDPATSVFKMIEKHEGGHYVPGDKHSRNAVKNFLTTVRDKLNAD
jgi:hypothetical protein